MTLRAYLDALPNGEIAKFAAELGIGRVYLSQLAAQLDGREPSPELCVRIEQATRRAVTRPKLRSDWKRIWPELVPRARRAEKAAA